MAFLTRLYRNELPFSRRSIDIVKEILLPAGADGMKAREITLRLLKERKLLQIPDIGRS